MRAMGRTGRPELELAEEEWADAAGRNVKMLKSVEGGAIVGVELHFGPVGMVMATGRGGSDGEDVEDVDKEGINDDELRLMLFREAGGKVRLVIKSTSLVALAVVSRVFVACVCICLVVAVVVESALVGIVG